MSARIDVAVVGAGAAGLAAAVTSARLGQTTLLLDTGVGPGGTGGFSGLTTLCGLYDHAGEFLNDGFTREFAEAIAEGSPIQMGRVWVLPYRPAKFRAGAERFLNSSPNLRTSWNTMLRDVTVEDHRVRSINGMSVGAVIDCTGTAEVARAIGAECLSTDESTQAPAVLFSLEGVRRELDSMAQTAKVLLPLARAGFPPLTIQRGFDPDTCDVKFTGSVDRVPDLIAFLRRHISGFEKCQPQQKEFKLSHRAGRMIIGPYVLQGADVRAGRHFPDAVVRCAWPIEQWNASGQSRFEYLSPGSHYEIPARSLRARTVNNLFMAGKTISADVEAIASARVMGCCLATGEAAGQLASAT